VEFLVLRNENGGQSEVVGVLLLTSVIIILVGIVGLFVLSGQDTTRKPVADIEVTANESVVWLTHNGGDDLVESDVRVTFGRGGDGEWLLEEFDDADGSAERGRFEGGDRRVQSHSATGVISVTVVHVPTNTVLAQEFLDVPGARPTATPGPTPSPTPTPTPETVRWESAADWDDATSESGVVHEDYPYRDAGRVELGYSSSGPIAFWPFDEDGGSTATDVTGDNDGTNQGPDLGQPGVLGTTSYDFDGSDDYVSDATDLTALQETASVSAWIRTTQSGDDTMWQAPGLTGVESSGDENDIFWGWLDADGHIGMQTGNNPGAQSTTSVNDGNWHHVVLTREAVTGEVEVYIDGTLEDSATSRTGEITTDFDSIGRIEDTAGSPEYFDGRIDEFRVYDRVLSGSEVSTLYDTASTGSLTTGAKLFSETRDVSQLELRNLDVTRPSDVTVYVESDHNGDGTYEEVSDPIALDGSATYDVTGLSTDSDRFRLDIEFDSPDVTQSPSVGGVTLWSGG